MNRALWWVLIFYEKNRNILHWTSVRCGPFAWSSERKTQLELLLNWSGLSFSIIVAETKVSPHCRADANLYSWSLAWGQLGWMHFWICMVTAEVTFCYILHRVTLWTLHPTYLIWCITYDLRHIFICSCSSRSIFIYDYTWNFHRAFFSALSIFRDTFSLNERECFDRAEFMKRCGFWKRTTRMGKDPYHHQLFPEKQSAQRAHFCANERTFVQKRALLKSVHLVRFLSINFKLNRAHS